MSCASSAGTVARGVQPESWLAFSANVFFIAMGAAGSAVVLNTFAVSSALQSWHTASAVTISAVLATTWACVAGVITKDETIHAFCAVRGGGSAFGTSCGCACFA